MNERVQETAQRLEAAAREQGFFITPDDRVSAANAAKLIGMAAGTLKNYRDMGEGPIYYKVPCSNGNISYRITDIAFWIENSRNE